MKVLAINPNMTASITTLVADQLRSHLPPDAQVLPMTARSGDAVIATREGFNAAAASTPEMLRHAVREKVSFDAVLLACFGDPGLEEIQRATNVPVVGLAQASMRQAERLGLPYAVVTAGPAWEAILIRRFADWRASRLFKGVHLLEASGLFVLHDPMGVLPAVVNALDKARQAGAERVILGGAVFAGYKDFMTRHSIGSDRVLDCVEAAAGELMHANRPAASRFAGGS